MRERAAEATRKFIGFRSHGGDPEAPRALLDEIDGRTVLVFVDQATFIPAALYMEASRATMEGREIRHDTGSVVRMGSLADARGDPLNVERPQQLFSRWYGFSLTFPSSGDLRR